jgi:hypothetical protein
MKTTIKTITSRSGHRIIFGAFILFAVSLGAQSPSAGEFDSGKEARRLSPSENTNANPRETGGESINGPAQETRGLRVFTCGHSFHVWVAPMLKNLADKAGIRGHSVAGVSSIGGSRVMRHWDVPDEKNEARKALKAGNVDVLTLSPIWLPDEGIEKFARLAFEHNPNIRILVQEFWLPNDTYEPVYPLDVRKYVDHNATNLDELRKHNNRYRRDIEDVVRKLNKQLGKDIVFVVPVGEASIVLREKILKRKAEPVRVQWNLFRDNWGHPTPPLKVLAAYCNYAVIYKKSPVGLPMPEEFQINRAFASVSLNKLLQEIAWETVTSSPLTGFGTADGSADGDGDVGKQ